MIWGVRVLNQALTERGFTAVYTWLGATEDDQDLVWYWTHGGCSKPKILGEDYKKALQAARNMPRPLAGDDVSRRGS